MIKSEDLNFVWSKKYDPDYPEDNRSDFIAIAFGIDNKIEYVLGTYKNIFELLNKTEKFEDSSEKYNDDLFYLDCIINEKVIETIQIPEILWALLLSNCDIFILNDNGLIRPSFNTLGIIYYVKPGWTYHKINDQVTYIPPQNEETKEELWMTPEQLYEFYLDKLKKIKHYYSIYPPTEHDIIHIRYFEEDIEMLKEKIEGLN